MPHDRYDEICRVTRHRYGELQQHVRGKLLTFREHTDLRGRYQGRNSGLHIHSGGGAAAFLEPCGARAGLAGPLGS
jgi:hypothetical protein